MNDFIRDPNIKVETGDANGPLWLFIEAYKAKFTRLKNLLPDIRDMSDDHLDLYLMMCTRIKKESRRSVTYPYRLFSYEEIGQRFGVSKSTVSRKLVPEFKGRYPHLWKIAEGYRARNLKGGGKVPCEFLASDEAIDAEVAKAWCNNSDL